jgi:2-polyprenyl-3-methyl-5-hydroxy-6-metoxy-1,4-benzoquinol methylase
MDLYNDKAADFFRQYEAVAATKVHRSWLGLISQQPQSRALDIGAGSGRDARFLASLGFRVTAVEPANVLREQAIAYGQQQPAPKHEIEWLADQLPNLTKVVGLQQSYDLVLLSAVWMHLTTQQRALTLPVLASLMAPDALLVLTLRHGDFSDGRQSYPVSADEILQLIQQHHLPMTATLVTDLEPDTLGRSDVLWQTVVLKKE